MSQATSKSMHPTDKSRELDLNIAPSNIYTIQLIERHAVKRPQLVLRNYCDAAEAFYTTIDGLSLIYTDIKAIGLTDKMSL